jgi:hypothetical protein
VVLKIKRALADDRVSFSIQTKYSRSTDFF